MTGFGAIENESELSRLNIRLRAVNGRFLDLRTHIPPELYSIESEIKKRVSKLLKRGTVDIYIQRKSLSSASVKVSSKADLAKQWLKTYKSLAQELKLDATVSMEQLSKVNGIIQMDESHKISNKDKQELFKFLDVAVSNCDTERQREGKSIAKDLKDLISALELQLKQIEKKRTEANDQLEKRYKQRLKKFGMDNEADPQRIAQEIVIQIDRADITEEILRLKEHFRAIKKLFTLAIPIGKKLDFYTQELLREVNTIGSKSQIAEITAAVVESKSIIERFREIVQNVE